MSDSATGMAELREQLLAYAAQVSARQAVLLDASGYVLCSVAAPGEESEPVLLGALAAGTFQAARELAALFGEGECRAFLQQGAQTGIYTLLIGGRWFFITAFDRLSHVGLVQMQAAQAAHDLASTLEQMLMADDATQALVASAAFRASVDDAIDRLLQEDHPPTDPADPDPNDGPEEAR